MMDYLAGLKAFLVLSLAMWPITGAALLVKAANALFDDDPPTGCMVIVLVVILAALVAGGFIGWWSYHALAVVWK